MVSPPIAILLGIAIVLIWKPVTSFLVLLVAYLRVPISATHADRAAPLVPWSADQALALSELFSLGFDPDVIQVVYETAGQKIPTWYFCHREQPVIAGLSDLINPMTIHSFSFYSFTPGGDSVLTTNRAACYFGRPEQPHVLHADSTSSTLEEHFTGHLKRARQLNCVPYKIDLAIERIATRSEAQFDWLRQCGNLHLVDSEWHFSLPVAIRRTLHWRQMVKRSRKPYTSPVAPDGATALRHRCAMFALYSMQRQGRRRDIKVLAFIFTLILALIAWGWLFTWPTAVALVAIILFHESGHAAAIWAFGQRDISMFLIPFVGAVVTAKPGQLVAWQQMLILLAGPLPGLLIGCALLIYGNSDAFFVPPNWTSYALLAIFVNLFNLLPIGFLDGGQLVDLAAFARLPRARFSFQLASVFALVVVAYYTNGVAAWVIAGTVALSLWPQLGVMRLSRAWRDGLSETEQISNLFRASTQLGMVSFSRQCASIRGVIARQAMRRCRKWESALIILIMATIWSGAIGVLYGGWFAASFGLS